MDGVADDALARLMEHDWPGNVRELENVIESALALAKGPWLRAADLPMGRNRRALPFAVARVAAPEGAGTRRARCVAALAGRL